MTPERNLANNIRYFRELNDMSQEELGLKVGVSAACISNWELMSANPKYVSLKKLASVFGLTVEEPYEEQKSKFPIDFNTPCTSTIDEKAVMLSELEKQVNNLDGKYTHLEGAVSLINSYRQDELNTYNSSFWVRLKQLLFGRK